MTDPDEELYGIAPWKSLASRMDEFLKPNQILFKAIKESTVITPVSRQAYQAEYDILDMALQSERGAQRLFYGDGTYRDPARGQARQFLTRLNKARDYDRQMSMKIYSPEHPQYGQTEYAKLYIPAPNYDPNRKAWVLQIQRNTIEGMHIEEIPPRDEVEVIEEEEFERRI